MLTSVDILYAAILTLIVWILVDLCSFSLYFFLFFSLCKAILTCCHTNEVIIIVVCVPCVFHGLCVGVYRHITDPSPHLLTFYQNQHKWLLIFNYVQCLTLCMYHTVACMVCIASRANMEFAAQICAACVLHRGFCSDAVSCCLRSASLITSKGFQTFLWRTAVENPPSSSPWPRFRNVD